MTDHSLESPKKSKSPKSSKKSPRTPRSGKKKSPSSSAGSSKGKHGATAKDLPELPLSPTAMRHSLQLPEDSEVMSVFVYDKPKNGQDKIEKDPSKRQGVWEDGYSSTISPTELWLYLQGQEPYDLEGSKHIYGCWGFRPNIAEPTDDLWTNVDPADVWCFSPNGKLPKHFVVKGVWTYPLVKRTLTHLAPETSGFVHVSDATKEHKLDVAGSWKMLYKRGAENDGLGPGMIPRVNIIVKNPKYGTSFPMRLKVTEPVELIWENIEKDPNGKLFPKEHHKLAYRNKVLENDKATLEECGIPDNAMIELRGMRIHIQHWDGHRFPLHVVPDETVDQIMDMIEKQEGIPKAAQRLTWNEKPLSNGAQMLWEYRIPDNAILDLEPMEITVKTSKGRNIRLLVDPQDTIGSIKKKVQQRASIPVEEQRLAFEGKILDDGPTLMDYGIKHGDTFDLIPMQIIVKDWNNRDLTLEVTPSETLGSIKEKIAKEKQLAPSQQFLHYEKELLDDDKLTLKEYGIPHGGIVNLDRFRFYVDTPRGKMALRLEPETTVLEVKQKVREKVGIQPKHQILEFDFTALPNDTTLAENGIGYKDTLMVRMPTNELEAPATPTQGPEFTVTLGDWQSPFDYNPKGKVEHIGTRARPVIVKNLHDSPVAVGTEMSRWG